MSCKCFDLSRIRVYGVVYHSGTMHLLYGNKMAPFALYNLYICMMHDSIRIALVVKGDIFDDS